MSDYESDPEGASESSASDDGVTLNALREAFVHGLRGRGEPLLVSDDGAIPAAALYAAVHCRRRGWTAHASGGDLGSAATSELVRVLAELWEGRTASVVDDFGWLPTGEATPAAVVAALARTSSEPRDLRVEDLRELSLAAAVARVLQGSRTIDGARAVERWGGLVR